MKNSKQDANSQGIGRRDFIKGSAVAAAGSMLFTKQSAAQSYAGANSYAGKPVVPGAPKPWNVPQRPGPPISIDVHTHWAPEAYLKAKAELGKPDYANPINYDMDRRIKWMDQHGVKTLVLTLGGFMPWQWVTPEQGAHIAQVTNDAAIEVHAAHPDRFLAGIELPVGDPVGSLKELNRVAGKPGMVAVHLPNSLASREYLFEPEFAPVLARSEELGLPLLIHPLDGVPNFFAGHRLDDAYSGVNPTGPASLFPGLTNSIGETFEQATTVSKLIVSGTLDKYPNLQMIIAHAGGAFPYIVGRLDHGTGNMKLQHPVREYIRRFYFDSLTFYPITLRYVVDLVGSDRVVLGTDNAFGPTYMQEQPHSLVDQLNLPDADRDLILKGNLTKLFKVKEA
jgi:aminocarboxymuconate-semialdehyde decarboxylase